MSNLSLLASAAIDPFPSRPLIWAVPVRLMSCLAACARCHLFFQAANGVLALGDRRGSSFNGALESGGEVLMAEFYPLLEGAPFAPR